MTQLQDRHVFYPEDVHPDEMVSKIVAVLARAANQEIFASMALFFPNFLQRICWKAGVNPAVPLIALVRERRVLVHEAAGHDWAYACGVVGSDQPGQINARWNGLLTQALMCVELSAWYIGAGPDDNFGYRVGLEPHAVGRWPKQQSVQILDENHKVVKVYTCANAAEYCQLTFTPHLGMGGQYDSNTLEVNGKILEEKLPEFL